MRGAPGAAADCGAAWRAWVPYATAGLAAAALLPWARRSPEGLFLSRLPGGQYTIPQEIPDVATFARDGDAILAGQFGEAYRGYGNAAGPLQCVLDRLLAEVARVSSWGVVAWLVMFAVLALAGGGAACLARASGRGRRERAGAAVATVVLASVAGLPVLAWNWGHWWQVPVAFGWWAAARWAASGRWAMAGLALGAGMAVEPWAALGVLPVLVLARDWRVAVRASAVSLTGLLAWVPVAAVPGSHGFNDIAWSVLDSSAWSLLGFAEFGTMERAVQGALVAGLATGVAWMARRRLGPAWAGWIAALAALLLRLGLDSIVIVYYWQAIAALLACGAAAAVAARAPRAQQALVCVLAVGTVPWWTPWLPRVNMHLDRWSFLAALACVAMVVAWLARMPVAPRRAGRNE